MKDQFKNRRIIIQLLFVLAGVAFLSKLLYIQLLDDTYKDRATQNVIRRITVYPTRGLIFDRNNKLIVVNDPIYDLMVIPNQVKNLDTIKFCELLDISAETFHRNLDKAKAYSRYKPSIFIKQVDADMYERLQEYLYRFPGFYGQVRTTRGYPHKSAAHMLGYIGEVNQNQINESDGYYSQGDYIGINGIEKVYEEKLRGTRGVRFALVDVHNREQGKFKGGALDTMAVSGSDLQLSIDIELQKYGELLMQNKRGSVVAIEPSTGEILAMISSPAYDPNLLSGRKRGEVFAQLARDTLKPLFNRPIMANYPPGSTFKPLMALLALEEGIARENDGIGCTGGGYVVGGFRVGCHRHASISDVQAAIQYSCNAYFCHYFRKLIDNPQYKNVEQGLDKWSQYLMSSGLGHKLGIDIPNEVPGLIPTAEYYNRVYKGHKWRSLMVVSLAIGQGEMGATPLQLANMMALIANKGWYYTPHIAKDFKSDENYIDSLYGKKNRVEIKPQYFDMVIDGLERVVLAGTARVAQIPGVSVCGKTGTAENPHGKDHSTFVAFAPKENTKIAIAVFVENAGFGSQFAAPIASLMMEKYLNDTIATNRQALEKKMMEINLNYPPVVKNHIVNAE